MISKNELAQWLATLPEDEWVGIEDGGLTLQTASGDQYIEVGGTPEVTA
jgi:hypothetical protein